MFNVPKDHYVKKL